MASKREGEGVCPVDHSTREAWLKNTGKQPEYHDAKMEKSTSNDADKCPVDHSSREAWLKQAKHAPSTISSNGGETFDLPTAVSKEDCSSDRLDSNSVLSNASRVASATGLSTDREISTIPRSGGPGGNWVYPSQAQFYAAMQRKNWDPQAEDMKSVVPIHNAVNERAWSEIMKWEEPVAKSKPELYKCGGPQLVSFSGDARKLTPRARFNMMFLGWKKPFDRHDWVVDRCGTQTVEYVIDFYPGKENPHMRGLPSFYLDVRPKLNSFEGCRMRFMKFIGF